MGSPDPHQLQGCANSRLFRQHVVADRIVSAVTERGSYPFPFRTRKSSPSSPMVPGPRARESRSPLDSRPLRGKPRRGLFLYPLHFVTLSRPQPVDTGCLSLTAPCPIGRGPLRFYRPLGSIISCMRGPASLSPPRPVSTGRLRLTAPCRKRPRGLFYARITRPRHAELGSASASCARAVARIARGFRGGAIRREGSAQRSASEGEASPFLNTFYLQINTNWNIPIWNFDNLSIAIFILHWFLACANYTLISGW